MRYAADVDNDNNEDKDDIHLAVCIYLDEATLFIYGYLNPTPQGNMMIVGVSISDEPRDRGMQDGGLRSARATHEQHDAMKTGLHTRATRTTLTTAPLPHALRNKRKLCA